MTNLQHTGLEFVEIFLIDVWTIRISGRGHKKLIAIHKYVPRMFWTLFSRVLSPFKLSYDEKITIFIYDGFFWYFSGHKWL